MKKKIMLTVAIIAIMTSLALTASAQNVCVGVGTQSPEYKLDVDGTFRVTDTSYFASSVGIGTSAPSATLQVVGTGDEEVPNGELDSEQGEKTVTGTGTLFTMEVSVGDVITVDENTADEQERVVAAIESDTELTVDRPFDPPLTNEVFLVEKPVATFTSADGDNEVSINGRGDVVAEGDVIAENNQWGNCYNTGPKDTGSSSGWVTCDAGYYVAGVYVQDFNKNSGRIRLKCCRI